MLTDDDILAMIAPFAPNETEAQSAERDEATTHDRAYASERDMTSHAHAMGYHDALRTHVRAYARSTADQHALSIAAWRFSERYGMAALRFAQGKAPMLPAYANLWDRVITLLDLDSLR